MLDLDGPAHKGSGPKPNHILGLAQKASLFLAWISVEERSM